MSRQPGKPIKSALRPSRRSKSPGTNARSVLDPAPSPTPSSGNDGHGDNDHDLDDGETGAFLVPVPSQQTGGISGGGGGGSSGSSRSMQDFTDEEIDELRDAFGMYDEDGNGHITEVELRHVIGSLGKEISAEEVREMIRSVDENGDGEIDFPEFLVLMSKHGHRGTRDRKGMAAGEDDGLMDEQEIEELRQAFEVFDTDQSGFISLDELQSLMKGLGQELSRRELDAMMIELDKDHDGQISFDEFKMLMSGQIGNSNHSNDPEEEEVMVDTDGLADLPEEAMMAMVGMAGAAAASSSDEEALRDTLKLSNRSDGTYEESSTIYRTRGRGGGAKGRRVAPAPPSGLGDRQSSFGSQPRLPPQYRQELVVPLQRGAGSLQNVFEDSFGTLAVDIVASRPKNLGVGEYFKEITDAEEHNLEYDFTFLSEPDKKGFTGLHKLINGIPYEGENHRGWRALMEYVSQKRADGQLVLELQEFQKKTTPMLMTCCRKPPVEVVRAYIETTRTVLTQEHGRYHGMIPIHFACKFFASREVIALLVKERPDSIVWQDKSDRTPLHCALNNFESKLPPPHIIDILLKAVDDEGNVYTPVGIKNKNGCTPLHYLVFSSKSIDPNDPDQEGDRDNAFACVDSYFRETDLAPQTLLKELMPFPDWLVGHVLSKEYVRKILNEITCGPFCTNQLLTQVYARCIIVAAFWIMSLNALERRRLHGINGEAGMPRYFGAELVILYVAVGYLILWEIARVYSLVKIRMFTSWITDAWNFVDLSCVGLVLASSILSNTGKGNDKSFWVTLICTAFATWLLLISFLKACNREFAIFLNSVIDIMRALVPFIVMMTFTILAFTHMYQLDGRGMLECYIPNSETFTQPAFCTFGGTMLKVFTMFTNGFVDEELYENRGSTRAISIVFALIVVVLLINVIIAVMVRSQADAERRGESFFYRHRFHLCAAVYKVYKLRPRRCRPAAGPKLVNQKDDKLQVLWDILVVAYGDPFKAFVRDRKIKLDEQFAGPNLVKRLLLGAPKCKQASKKRRMLFAVLMPLWTVIGALSFGLLWPPCIRRWLLCPDDEKLRRQKVGEAGSYIVARKEKVV